MEAMELYFLTINLVLNILSHYWHVLVSMRQFHKLAVIPNIDLCWCLWNTQFHELAIPGDC